MSIAVASAAFGAQLTVARAQNSNATNVAVTNTPGAGRLEAAKLRACQNREAALNRIMSRMTIRAEKQLDVFSTIASRVEAFYAQKGRTIATYAALVADVSAKKIAAETQIATLDGSSTLSCSGDDPKGLASAFKVQLRATTAALQAYKTAIKNLIVGVKSAQGQSSSNRNTNAVNTNTP